MFKRLTRMFSASLLVVFCLLLTLELRGATNGVQQQPDGILLRMPNYLLRIQVISDSVLRIAAARDISFFSRSSIDVVPRASMTRGWKSTSTPTSVTISTARLRIHINRTTGVVKFLDAGGNEILSESEGSRKIDSASVQGENTFHVAQRWKSNP